MGLVQPGGCLVAGPGLYVRLALNHHEPGHAVSHVDRSIDTYIERCRKRIPSFVDANFSVRQTWTLQRPTLWIDLACAPINSAWALPHLAIYKAAETAERVGYPQPARWAKRLPRGIKTGYQRQIERRICRDLHEWDRDQSPAPLPQGLLKELESVPALREQIETRERERFDRTTAKPQAGSRRSSREREGWDCTSRG